MSFVTVACADPGLAGQWKAHGRRFKATSETAEYGPMGARGLHIKYGNRVDGPYPKAQLREALPKLPPGVQVWVNGGWVDLAVGLNQLADRRPLPPPPPPPPVPIKSTGGTGGRWAMSLIALVLILGAIQTSSESDDNRSATPSTGPQSGGSTLQQLTYDRTFDVLGQTYGADYPPCDEYATVGDQLAFESMEVSINSGGYSMNHAAFTDFFAGRC